MTGENPDSAAARETPSCAATARWCGRVVVVPAYVKGRGHPDRLHPRPQREASGRAAGRRPPARDPRLTASLSLAEAAPRARRARAGTGGSRRGSGRRGGTPLPVLPGRLRRPTTLLPARPTTRSPAAPSRRRGVWAGRTSRVSVAVPVRAGAGDGVLEMCGDKCARDADWLPAPPDTGSLLASSERQRAEATPAVRPLRQLPASQPSFFLDTSSASLARRRQRTRSASSSSTSTASRR